MARRASIGLKSIKMGNIAPDGAMGAALTALDATFQGTASLVQEEGQRTDFFCEELVDPVETVVVPGATTLKWSIVDFTPSTLARVLGGSATGTGDDALWEAPDSVDLREFEQSIEIVTNYDLKIEIPRAKVTALINWNLSRTEIAKVDITARVLQPTAAGVPRITISKTA